MKDNNTILECVPNFSEGRDKGIIDQIAQTIRETDNVKLLNIDIGYDANRTVMTFIGKPDAIIHAAFKAISKAGELIDMTKQNGTHPRLGATDVCPLIPVIGISMQECIEYSRTLGNMVARELSIPVYMYEESASTPVRKNLANIRNQEYEGLSKKITLPKWQPDFGEPVFNARSGATVIGARKFLIAYNIDLDCQNEQIAKDIALEIHEKGRSLREGNISPVYLNGDIINYSESTFPCGSCQFTGSSMDQTIKHCQEIHNYDLKELLKMHNINPENAIGKPVKMPGILLACKAIGWMVKEYNCVQVSMNLTNYTITSMHMAMETCRKLATKRNIKVTGSELIGMVPRQAILATGEFYLKRDNEFTGSTEEDAIQKAIDSLNLRGSINKQILGCL